MKAFIFVALVASVAARSLDLETLRVVNKEKSLLNTPVVANKVLGGDLLKEQLKKDVLIGQENVLDTTVLPVQDKTVGGIYNYDNVVDVDRVLTIQELYTTELFKEYLQIPLFRQYIQYPSFQRFVSSVYFQRFWQLPAYKQYYVNPILFYKYVYPIVTELFNTEYTVPSVYGQNEDVLGLGELLKNKNFLPYAYNYNRFSVPTTAFPGTTTNYKFLLEKLNKNLYTNQKVQDFQVKTDVKLIPEKVVVEPITNKVVVEEPKIVDVQVDQKIVPFVDSIVPVTTDSVAINERDVYLLKQLLNENIITPEVFQAVIYGKVNFVTFLNQLIARGGINADLLNTIIARLQVVDTVVPYTTDSVVLSERQIVILKDLLQKNYITPEIYQAIIVGKYEFTTVIRQVLERRGITSDLISLIINRLVAFDTVVPVSTEQDVYIVKELLRQRLITSEVYQAVLVGKLDFFTLIRQIIVRRDVIDSVIPTVDSVVLTERNFALLKDLLRQNVISQEIYEAVLYGKYDFVTVLRQVLERKQIPFNLITLIVNRLVRTDIVDSQQDTYLLKELLRQRLITSEIYQAVIFNKIDFFTVLRQVIFRDIPFTSDITPFVGNDRYNFNVNKYYGYKNLYNTEIPTFRDNIYNYNRYPIVA